MRKWNEESSKKELLEAIDSIIMLGEYSPRFGMSIIVQELKAKGYFDVEARPWDFLVLVGCVIFALGQEIDGKISREADDAVNKACDIYLKAMKVYQKPMKWMYEAVIEEENARRYILANGESLPSAGKMPRRIPRSLAGEVIFSWPQYAQLRYVLNTFVWSKGALEWNDDEFSLLYDMRKLLLSMERKPQVMIDLFSRTMAELRLERISKILKMTQCLAEDFERSGCTLENGAKELAMLKELARNLGYEATFTPIKTGAASESKSAS